MAQCQSYEEFIEKFKLKKTTDDCYTPDGLMADIIAYICTKYKINPDSVLRPFYPGGDYQSEDYTGKIVIDNPPFSLMSEILQYYRENNVPAFLFCPGLTASAEQINHWTTIVTYKTIVYDNGAKVATNFVHNFTPETVITTDPEIIKILETNQPSKTRQKQNRPDYTLSIADLRTASRHKNFMIQRADVISTDYKVYGRGLKLTEEKYKEIKS